MRGNGNTLIQQTLHYRYNLSQYVLHVHICSMSYSCSVLKEVPRPQKLHPVQRDSPSPYGLDHRSDNTLLEAKLMYSKHVLGAAYEMQIQRPRPPLLRWSKAGRCDQNAHSCSISDFRPGLSNWDIQLECVLHRRRNSIAWLRQFGVKDKLRTHVLVDGSCNRDVAPRSSSQQYGPNFHI